LTSGPARAHQGKYRRPAGTGVRGSAEYRSVSGDLERAFADEVTVGWFSAQTSLCRFGRTVLPVLKDLRRRFNGEDEARTDWALDPAHYTLAQVANRLRSFLFEEKAAAYAGEVWTRVRLCGYSAGRPLAEVWEILLLGPNSPAPTQVQGEQDFGIRWDGEYEALSRLIFGLGTGFEDTAAAAGLTPDAARDLHAKLSPALFELLFVEAMPIRDAVDLARFLVETTIGFVKFSIARPKTVGGAIAIAAITKHQPVTQIPSREAKRLGWAP
jgi:hypothetical protein